MNMTVAIKTYLNWKGATYPRAAYNYRIWLDRFEKEIHGKTLHEVDANDVARFQIRLKDRFAPRSVELAMVVLSNFFRFHRLNGEPCISPNLIQIPKARSQSYAHITESDYSKLLSQTKTNEFHELQKNLTLRILWETGVRVSELCAINVADLDLDAPGAMIRTKKNTTLRKVIWSEETENILEKFLKLRIQLVFTPSLFVGQCIGGRLTQRITPRTIQRWIKTLCKAAGIDKPYSPHSFRHGWAHVRRDQGVSLAFIQKGLGHQSPNSTFVYEQYADNEYLKTARKCLKKLSTC
jgi:site-specific recombinase XerD